MERTRYKQIYEEASAWVVDVRVGDMDAAARKRLDTWLRQSPIHIRAFLRLSCLWEEAEESDLDRGNSKEALIALARAGTNVFALEGEGIASQRDRADPLDRRPAGMPRIGMFTLLRSSLWRPGVLASVVVACLALGLVTLKVYWDPNYATGTGQQRTVHLADGSTIELNSRSRVRVLFSERERDVELLEGQALFRVAKDAARPFLVESAGTRVRAVGTQFDVYRKASGTQVTVVEGRVAVFASGPPRERGVGEISVSAAARSAKEQRLAARGTDGSSPDEASAVLVSTGEQVTVINHEVPKPRRADLRAATAWTQRKLVFEETSLAEVVQEFNRYNTRKLVVSDPALMDLRVTGVFSSVDPASLLRFLRGLSSVDVVEDGQEIRISRK